MKKEHTELWARIRGFSLDESGSDLTFTRRLARENGWTEAYARRVVEEYKKFMLLVVAAGHPASPSDQVDQAWHLHMTYTKSYWERFCREALCRPLHHEPTRGGLDEGRKYAAMYEKTLGSYRAFFGQEPPADIWPETRSRFSEDTRFERVNLDRNLIVSRDNLRGAMVFAVGTIGAVLLALFGESLVSAFESAMNLHGPEFLGFYFLVVCTVLLGGLIFRWSLRKPSDEPTAVELDLDAYEVAYLAGGEKRAANAAIAGLFERGALNLLPVEHQVRRVGAPTQGAHPLECTILGAADLAGTKISQLHAAAKPALEQARSRLRMLGLLVSEGREIGARTLGVLMVLATVAFGFWKVSVGLERHRPVLFLILLVLASGVAGLLLLGRKLGRSRRGDRALDQLRHHYRGLETRAAGAESGLTALEVPMAAALFGVAALSGGNFDILRDTLKPPSTFTGGGGGGCGGGCGGCGS